MDTYTQVWGGSHPGCLIFLLDQSGSMADPFGAAQAGAGRRKCDMVATVLNGFLNELIVTNTVAQKDGTTEVRPRAEVTVIGYEGISVCPVLAGELEGRNFVGLPELQMNPLDIERRKRKEIDDTGQEVEISVPFPVWVKPRAGGGTPMRSALQQARDLAQQWASAHPDNYPPVVINVTDGVASDGDPTGPGREICEITTADGHALLFNVHITDINSAPIAYPASIAELPNDKYARMLFEMSSVIPETSRNLLQSLLGRPVMPGARGLIFNGDAASVRQMFVFASVPGTQPLDPSR
ncbi:VWA domain-containing protein [Ktedonosporobacter rubrisoli]|uniref:VWA domain-containing protein n=1 Tax=Ktedonosporobacter rubrisoli TaxID=2509675 RepID=A0A4P6JXT0_KTERU|nr:VWA domain-containing protein [Ktedonosporobacter rubrisoli]QBD80578.1 VWA domain-containing protein [Ktedonosporobacter rubrisoli]